MASTSPRENVAVLMQELGRASRRPLFVEIALIRSKQREEWTRNEEKEQPARPEISRQNSGVATSMMDTTSERSFSGTSTRRGGPPVSAAPSSSRIAPPEEEGNERPSSRRTWVELLSEASELVPFLTEEEHGKILRIASILFLGFLLPYSTGNDFYLLQNNTERPTSDAVESSMDEYLLQLPLEERIEKSVTRNLSSNEYGEDPDGCLTDPDVELALDDFVRQLGILLQRRPLHREEVDLVHLLAMAIQPSCNPEDCRASPLFADNPSWLRTKRLMEMSAYASQFQIHYGHRLRIVRLVLDCLVLPDGLNESSGDVVAPLLFGSLLHLRTSLHSFGAHSTRDSVLALAASMAVAAQSRSVRVLMKPEWNFFLNYMLEDWTDYQCAGICHHGKDRSDFFCPHSARGRVLGDFIVRSCRSREDADRMFLLHITVSLTEAIEWQVDCIADKKDEGRHDEEKEAALHAPCLLASLLHAASQLFYFQPSLETNYEGNEEDPYRILIQSSIRLLRHSDTGIVTESAKLLAHAFSNTKRNAAESYASLLFETIKVCVNQKMGSRLSTLVSVVSSQSPSFASTLFSFLLETLRESKQNDAYKDSLYRLLPAISLNCPQTARKDIDIIVSLLNDASLSMQNSQHVTASILSSRLAYFFVDKNDKTQELLSKLIGDDRFTNECSSNYQLARLSLQTGNFAVATGIFESLLGKCSSLSELHFIWLSLLGKIAKAESSLSNNGAMGIPDATVELQSAVSYLHSLGLFSSAWKESHDFQRWFLLLRLDFLDLVTVLRQLAREMRLTGSGPAKNTRSLLHLRNVVRGFDALSNRYRTLKQRHGLFFRDCQSGAALDVLRSLSSFMAIATKAVFSESFLSRTTHKDTSKTSQVDVGSKVHHPMTSLLCRLDELVIQPLRMDTVDPIVRAAAILELIDGVLQVPAPIPRDFFVPQPTASCDFRISASPDSFDETLVTIESAPMLPCIFYASGHIPRSFLKKSIVPAWTILLWFRLDYSGPLVDDEDNKDDDAGVLEEPTASALKMPDLSRYSPASTTLFPDGHFFFAVKGPPLTEEGLYRLEARLGCRDARGTEWDVPASTRHCIIRISRSRLQVS